MKAERPARLVLPSTAGAAGPARGAAKARAAGPVLEDAAAALFEALRRHRLGLARAQGVPPFVIASDRTLRDIAILSPTTIAQLRTAHGIGDAKAERYGAGLLGVVESMRRS